jgi:polysaccharide pyruvyl transferase WcaK-like protein
MQILARLGFMNRLRRAQSTPTRDTRAARRSSCSRVITVVGVFGRGNFGDEALLEVILNDLFSTMKKPIVRVLCSNPNNLKHCQSVTAYSRKPFPKFLSKLASVSTSDIFIVGGGTQLFDQGSFVANIRGVAAYYFWVLAARLFQVSTVAYAQGFEPGDSCVMRAAVRALPTVVHWISVRDSASLKELGRVATSKGRVSVTCDPVLGSELFLPEHVLARLSSNEISSIYSMRPFMAVAFRSPPRMTDEESVPYLRRAGRLACDLTRDRPVAVVLFPAELCHPDTDDRRALREVRRGLLESGFDPGRLHAVEWGSVEEAACWLQAAVLVFSNRLHPLLVASLANTPILAAEFPRKIRDCLSELGPFLPYCTILDENLRLDESHKRTLQSILDRPIGGPSRISADFHNYRRRHLLNLKMLRAAARTQPARREAHNG